MKNLYSAELWSCTGVCSLRGNAQGVADMAKYTVLYYAGTTALSVCLGIALVSVIFPGRGHPLSSASMHGNCHHTVVPQVLFSDLGCDLLDLL